MLNAAADEHRAVESATLRRWGSVPQTPAAIEPWANLVAQREVDADPRIVEARNRQDEARADQQRLTARQTQERAEIRSRMYGDRPPTSAHGQAERWRQRAEATRRELAAIEALPATQAAQLIRARAERERAQNQEEKLPRGERQDGLPQLRDATRQTPHHGSPPRDHDLGR